MIRFLFLLIIAGIVLALAFFQFKSVSIAKKMTLAGGGLASAAIGILVQDGLAWYMPILAIVAVSLAAALIYKKLEEREELEKKQLAEERKERRQNTMKTPATKTEPEKFAPETLVPTKIDIANEPGIAEESKIKKDPETVTVRETIKRTETVAAREANNETETIPIREKIAQPEEIQVRETIKVPDDEEMPEKPYGMQSIQPVGKER